MPPPARPDIASLDSLQRDAITVLALDATVPRSRSHWHERATAAGLQDARGRKITGEAFKQMVTELAVAGAIRQTPRPEYVVASRWLPVVIEDAQRRGRLASLALELRRTERSYTYYGSLGRIALLVALAQNDEAALRRAEEDLALAARRFSDHSASLVWCLGMHPPLAWLERLAPEHRRKYLADALELAFVRLALIGDGPRRAALAADDEELRGRLALVLALEGDADGALAALVPDGSAQWTRAARAFIELAHGDLSKARELFAEAGVSPRGKRAELPGCLVVFDALLAVSSDRAADVADVPRRMRKAQKHLSSTYSAMNALHDLFELRTSGLVHPAPLAREGTWIDDVVVALANAWTKRAPREPGRLPLAAHAARECGYAWVGDMLERIASGDRVGSWLALFSAKAPWELALESLRGVVSDAPKAPRPSARQASAAQIWWTVSDLGGWTEVTPTLASSVAVKGKRLSAQRILEDDELGADEHDRRVASAILASRERSGYYGRDAGAIAALVDHPRVRDDAGKVLRLEASEPRLHVERTIRGARVTLAPSSFDDTGIALDRAPDGRVLVCRRTPVIARVLAVLPPGGLEVPEEGLGRLFETLGALGAHVPVDVPEALAGDARAGDARIHAQLFRAGSGLRARLRVVPGGDAGPALRPGAPPSEVLVPGEQGLTRVARDLDRERADLERVLEACPTLASIPLDGDDRVARDLETCLELLLELRAVGPEVVVDWMEGQPLRVPAVANLAQMRVRAKGDDRWLNVEGELRIDEQRVLEMRALLDGASRARGRFVPIGEDEWLALTGDLAKRLDALGRVERLGKGGRVSTALLPAVEGLLEGAEVSFSAALETRRVALERAREREAKVPRDLAAELRPYQLEGFRFLAQRADAGLGACLADDMGLGKTVQALALLLHRRAAGPALVVAPTSVCRNWEDEAARFAPSLVVKRLGDGDRSACVQDAAKGDLVVVSYGMLTAAGELLARREWGTVIFDEAHALKNADTRRWAAARDLRAKAAVALTGTPVENHASDLHALFDLLVPGMLGSRAAFEASIGAAIAEGDRDAAALLRQIVRPFILRRTKGEVLTELPPKTEVLHVVEASAEHLAFYEATRRRALEKIARAKEAGGPAAAQARIQVLAEITRLRRAAIDPRLVSGEDAPSGAKLDALVALVTELRAERRRALVFSQFLEVLELARERLEASGAECRRLDGTMSERARADEVSAFQSGRGDVFLVSLKAGGVGMNLTAADFVILLDPWWNPAVEDQAAGRAHRIGQSRAVTVARIITGRTIEEKVLALQAKKRQLYTDVVASSDGAGALDIDAIAALLDEDWTASPEAAGSGSGKRRRRPRATPE